MLDDFVGFPLLYSLGLLVLVLDFAFEAELAEHVLEDVADLLGLTAQGPAGSLPALLRHVHLLHDLLEYVLLDLLGSLVFLAFLPPLLQLPHLLLLGSLRPEQPAPLLPRQVLSRDELPLVVQELVGAVLGQLVWTLLLLLYHESNN